MKKPEKYKGNYMRDTFNFEKDFDLNSRWIFFNNSIFEQINFRLNRAHIDKLINEVQYSIREGALDNNANKLFVHKLVIEKIVLSSTQILTFLSDFRHVFSDKNVSSNLAHEEESLFLIIATLMQNKDIYSFLINFDIIQNQIFNEINNFKNIFAKECDQLYERYYQLQYLVFQRQDALIHWLSASKSIMDFLSGNLSQKDRDLYNTKLSHAMSRIESLKKEIAELKDKVCLIAKKIKEQNINEKFELIESLLNESSQRIDLVIKLVEVLADKLGVSLQENVHVCISDQDVSPKKGRGFAM